MNGSVNMRSANCAVQSNSSMANGNPQVIRSGSPWFKWKWKWQQVNTKEIFGSSGRNWDAVRSVAVDLNETPGHTKRSERVAGQTCTRTRKEELLLCRHHHQRKFFRLVSVGRWRAVPNGRRAPDAAQKRVRQPRQPIMCLQCQMLLTCLILDTLYMTSHEFQFAGRNCLA